MINENEIRVGNYFKYNEKHSEGLCMLNIPTKWDSSDWYRVGECIDDLDWYDPIPLTEEILLKCGFEKEPMAYSKNIDLFGGGKKLTFSGDYFYIVDSEKQNTIPTDIITLWNKDVMKEFYLHQLQNLYFALTGEELTVNL